MGIARRRTWLDGRVHTRLVSHRATPADRALARLSHAADHSKLWFGSAAALAVVGGADGRRAAARGLISIGIASFTANVIGKRLVGGPRPDLTTVPLIRQTRRTATSGSFPSGHTASAVAFTTAVALEAPVAGLVLAPLAAGVGYARMHTGAHWFSDVVGGAVIGLAAAGATAAVSPPARLRRRFAPAPGKHVELPALPDGAGLVVVANPGSGAGVVGRVDPLDLVRRELPRAQIRELRDGEDYAAVFAEVAKDAEALGVCGGDGTVGLAAAAAAEEGKPLLVLPGGTFNHFAKAAGVDDVAATLRAVKAGTGVAVDIATARLGDERTVTVLNTFSLGIYPELVEYREQWQDRIGKPLAGAVAAVKALKTAEPVPVRIDDEVQPLWTAFVGVNNYRPRTAAPVDRDRLDDGVLDVRMLRALTRKRRFQPLLGELLGSLLGGRLRRRHQSLDASGEPFGMGSVREFRVTVMPPADGDVVLAYDGETVNLGRSAVPVTIAINDGPVWIYRWSHSSHT